MANLKNINQAYDLFFQQYPDVLDVKQLSKILNISTKTVYKLLENKEIRGFKVGREYRIPKLFILQYLQMADVSEESSD